MAGTSKKPQGYFITEDIRVYENEEARLLLRNKNDAQNVHPDFGIAAVSQSRWLEAQRYEKNMWCHAARGASDDRNEYHRERFANYALLRGMNFEKGIELGCGPFTNTRLILEMCSIDELHLLDPLLEAYLQQPFCRYRRGRLGGALKEFPNLYDLRHPIRFWKDRRNTWHIGGLFGRNVFLHPVMIESFKIDTRFDLVILINVLEHCQNAEAVFSKIRQILSPEGIFVFGDVLYEARDVKRFAKKTYDAGHPLRVDRRIIDKFLSSCFIPLMRSEYLVERKFHGVPLRYYELYFMGRGC